MNIWESFIHFLKVTPPDMLGAYSLLIIFPVSVFGVLVWGFIQIWLYTKQNQYWDNLKWDLLAISVPGDSIQSPMGMENFFNNLAGSKSAITWKEKWMDGKFQAIFSVEMVSIGGRIQFYIRCMKKYRDIVEAAFYAQYPEASILEVDDYIDQFPDTFPDEEYDIWGSEMQLRKDDYLPIKTYTMFEHMGESDLRFKDPILPFIEGMGKMRPGEAYMIQMVMTQPDEQDWRKGGEKFIQKMYGKEDAPKSKGFDLDSVVGWIPRGILEQITGNDFSINASSDSGSELDWAAFKITPTEKDRIDAVNRKIAKLGWQVKVRFVYIAKKELFRKGTIASMTKGLYHQFAYQGWNNFGIHGASTPKDDYPWQAWFMEGKQKTLWSKYKSRALGAGATPHILNSEELATMFHFPPADARTPVLTSLAARRAEAPIDLESIEMDFPTLSFESPEVKEQEKREAEEASQQGLSVPKPATPFGDFPSPPVSQEKGFEPESVMQMDHTYSAMPQEGVAAPIPPGIYQEQKNEETEDFVPTNLPV